MSLSASSSFILSRIYSFPAHCKWLNSESRSLAISEGIFFAEKDDKGQPVAMLNSKINELVTRNVKSYEDAINRITLAETDEKISSSLNWRNASRRTTQSCIYMILPLRACLSA